MYLHSTRLPYRETRAFSSLVLDYVDQVPALRPFFEHPPTLAGLQKSLDARASFPVDRNTLASVLEEQYQGLDTAREVQENIRLLREPSTFTVTTAHQNNLFGGPLYVFYKIAHTIRLAGEMTRLLSTPVIPVFYLGSEDADLDELNHVILGGEKHVWNTRQTGAVGRMSVDAPLLSVLEQVAGQLGVLPHGESLVAMLRRHYKTGQTIARALQGVLNEIFGRFGLVILIPDHPRLKAQLEKIWWEELTQQRSAALVRTTSEALENAGYKAQAQTRDINLFYLLDNRRERIERDEQGWKVLNTDIRFCEDTLRKELNEHPERFSPNVILRGLYQERILPNLAFIGGGGETAYWLQFRQLFAQYGVPFPVLVLRNSFLLVEQKWQPLLESFNLTPEDLFVPLQTLLDRIALKNSGHAAELAAEKQAAILLLEKIGEKAASFDVTLRPHTEAIRARTIKLLEGLEKKMARAARRNLGDSARQLTKLKAELFPANGLQERQEGFIGFLASWGPDFADALIQHSPLLEQEFTVLTRQD